MEWPACGAWPLTPSTLVLVSFCVEADFPSGPFLFSDVMDTNDCGPGRIRSGPMGAALCLGSFPSS